MLLGYIIFTGGSVVETVMVVSVVVAHEIAGFQISNVEKFRFVNGVDWDSKKNSYLKYLRHMFISIDYVLQKFSSTSNT